MVASGKKTRAATTPWKIASFASWVLLGFFWGGLLVCFVLDFAEGFWGVGVVWFFIQDKNYSNKDFKTK